VAQAESEAERETVANWWSELSTTRLNDPKQSAIVVIMQRLHESDVSGTILSGDDDWCHLDDSDGIRLATPLLDIARLE
jgi:hypothetical protein